MDGIHEIEWKTRRWNVECCESEAKALIAQTLYNIIYIYMRNSESNETNFESERREGHTRASLRENVRH